MYDIIIVGAGPAGLTSSIYARRAMKKTLVLEAVSYGGQIINTLSIENYPANPGISGFDFATKLYNQAKEMGSEVKFEKVTEIKDNGDYKEVITTKGIYETKTISTSFVGYFPSNEPKYAISITTPNISYTNNSSSYIYPFNKNVIHKITSNLN